LILIGLIDNSVIPIPGGMDVFVVVLAAHHRAWWFYYGFMATVGALVGGYVTYHLSEKGGRAALEKKVGKRRAEKVYRQFEKRGFMTLVVGSVLPPPFPLVPVLMTAGVMRYPRQKFLSALAVGRAARFFLLAFLARLYGTAVIGFARQYYKPLLYSFIGLGIAGGGAAFFYFKIQTHARASRQNA
jgi:membrane protein YqaA with SNARE-associated domain